MTIKTNIKEAYNCYNDIMTIAQSKEICAKVSYEIALILNELEKYIESYANCLRSCAEKYGRILEKGELGSSYEIDDAFKDQFSKEMDEVGIKDIIIENLSKIKLSDIDSVKISPVSMLKMMWLIEK